MSTKVTMLAVLLAAGFTLRAAAQTTPTSTGKDLAPPTELKTVATLRLAGLNNGLRSQVQVLKAEREEAQNSLEIARARYRAGQETSAEVLRAETAFKIASTRLDEAAVKLDRES